jgi:3'(2'), 5'-bisphosphate nucleotidase
MAAELSSSEIERDVVFAVEAARAAGRRALALRKSGRWTAEETLADIGDQACDGYLQGLLRGRYPDDGVLSEETADSPARLQRSRCWIVDPLDGTREFSQGREDWAVHVALTLDHKPALAAVGLPSQGQVLWGVALQGRERGAIEGEGPSELVRGDSQAPERLRLAISRSHTPEWTSRFAQILGVSETVPAGSAGYKVMLLLLGRADVYVHKRGLKEWDTCAPETVARAMGWTVCKLRGEEHRYNQQDYRNHELVVCRPSHKQQVLEALASAGALAAPS